MTWALFSLGFFVVSTAYCGSLVSFLTVDVLPPKMETLIDAAVKNYEYHAYGPIFKRQLLTTDDPRLRAMSRDVVQVRDPRATLEAVLEGRAVFFDSRTSLEYTIRRGLVDR